jgi:hypothetical protein
MKRYYYTANFIYLGQKLTISAYVTDKYEDMSEHERKYAASQGMTQLLREQNIYKNKGIRSRDLWQVKKTDAVKFDDTLAQIETAKKVFSEMPSSIEKLVISLAHANGVM